MSTTDRRQRLFGEIIGGEVILSTMGGIVQEEWLRTEIIRKEITLEAYVIMPNHFHGIVVIETSSSGSGSVRAHGHAPQPGNRPPQPDNHAPQPDNQAPQPGKHAP